MEVQGSLDVTRYILSSDLSEKLTPHLPQKICGATRTAIDCTFTLSVRVKDKALMLNIIFTETEEHHRSMLINPDRNRLGTVIQLSSRNIASLVAEAAPMLRDISYNPKNSVAT